MKSIGFDEPCLKTMLDFDITYESDVKIPLYQQAFRWFREKYNLKSWVEEYTKNKYIYEIRPHKITDYKEGEIYVYATYEEAELACLRKLIEIVKNK
jgi:hypothetical protein